MMKKKNFWRLVALIGVFTFLLCALCACDSPVDEESSSNAESSSNMESSSDTKSSSNTDVKTGTYNGQTITMEYTLKTDILFPQDMPYIRVINNYAVFYQYDSVGNPYDAWNAFDRQGNLLFDEPYRELTYFNPDGQAAAKKHSNEYVLVNTKGEETPITEAEYEEIKKDISDNYKEELANGTKDRESTRTVGYVYNSLAPYVQMNDENTALLGLVDAEGNIVIPAYIPINFNLQNYRLSLHEDSIIIDDDGYIGIVTIKRS